MCVNECVHSEASVCVLMFLACLIAWARRSGPSEAAFEGCRVHRKNLRCLTFD